MTARPRPFQPNSDGHEMDHYADDLAAQTSQLDLKDAVHVGHQPAAARYALSGRHGKARRQGRSDRRGAATDGEDQGESGGLPKEVFDGFQAQFAANRSQFYLALPRAFLRIQPASEKPSPGVIQNWWRQGMMGGTRAHSDGIVAFSQTDFIEYLKKITVPVLVIHGDDDQIVPYADSAPLTAKLLKGNIENLQGVPARHAHNECGHHQCRSADVPESVAIRRSTAIQQTLAIHRTGTPEASAERERERLDAGIEELDLELAIDDRLRLSDQLIQTLFEQRCRCRRRQHRRRDLVPAAGRRSRGRS